MKNGRGSVHFDHEILPDTLAQAATFARQFIPWTFTTQGLSVKRLRRSEAWNEIYVSYYETHNISYHPKSPAGWVRYAHQKYFAPYGQLFTYVDSNNTVYWFPENCVPNQGALLQILAHELVHAAQKQREPFNSHYHALRTELLGSHAFEPANDRPLSDRAFVRKLAAVRALSEGHANWIQRKAARTNSSRAALRIGLLSSQYRRVVRAAKSLDPNENRRRIHARYKTGLRLIRGTYREAGLAGIDALYDLDPTSLAARIEEHSLH